MASDEVSLETRASAAYLQGQLDLLIVGHRACKMGDCLLLEDLERVLDRCKQAEAELKAQGESK